MRVEVGADLIAPWRPGEASLPVGMRCVVLGEGPVRGGVVLEPPKVRNRFRYLVFSDQHPPCYVDNRNVRPTVGDDSYQDLSESSRSFLQRYTREYPEVPLARLGRARPVKVSSGGSWWLADLVEVDCSLALVEYQADSSREWIFRGSDRFESIHSMIRKSAEVPRTPNSRPRKSHVSLSTNTVIEYPREDKERRPLSRKSGKAAKRLPAITEPVADESSGKIVQLQLTSVERGVFRPHECSPSCVKTSSPVRRSASRSPLATPLELGWRREIARHSNLGRRRVCYVAPCGRRMRSPEEVHRFLGITQSSLGVEDFNFDWEVHVLDRFEAEKVKISMRDFSFGAEAVPISCVNAVDEEYPENLEYSTKRLPQNFTISDDDGFLVCCDCQDDCQDTKSCNCAKLTVESTAGEKGNRINTRAGYVYKRLHDIVPTGIYECNSQCRCSKTCLNRVVQNPLRLNLQLFKTSNRGWGLRTLNDIPAGTFICTYVGRLYEATEGNTVGRNFGDEYFADLDLIEVVEDVKRAPSDGEESDEGVEVDEESLEPEVKKAKAPKTQQVRKSTRKTTRKVQKKTTKPKEAARNFKSVRDMFGEGEESYIMDAKVEGNLGRFLNHSCYPNVFAQNVFVDSHDLR